MESQRNPELVKIHNTSGLTVPDGMPMVWMSRLLGFPWVERVYGPDLMLKISALSAEQGYRNFYYGGAQGTAERLKENLKRTFPGLNVVGTICPPFRPLTAAEEQDVAAQINAARPDIVWVGLSTPKQELWMSTNINKLNVPVLVGVGAAFDFLSGEKKQAPKWMQRNGLEWLFRMAAEPRRLAGRYIQNNPAFVYKALCQVIAERKNFKPAN
jgi:N-acetylglucosaminyldiphosphoundecaprenol N-acetyl-beta-D-mannosaminyltransferase